MSQDGKPAGVGGCLGGAALIWLVFVGGLMGTVFVGQTAYEFINPQAGERRLDRERAEAAAEATELQARRIEMAQREQADKLQAEEEAREERRQIEANGATHSRASEAAFERYAECQVRNGTPGRCSEDWKPTPEVEAYMEIMRGR